MKRSECVTWQWLSSCHDCPPENKNKHSSDEVDCKKCRVWKQLRFHKVWCWEAFLYWNTLRTDDLWLVGPTPKPLVPHRTERGHYSEKACGSLCRWWLPTQIVDKGTSKSYCYGHSGCSLTKPKGGGFFLTPRAQKIPHEEEEQQQEEEQEQESHTCRKNISQIVPVCLWANTRRERQQQPWRLQEKNEKAQEQEKQKQMTTS